MNTYQFYSELKKPSFAPPSSVFGPVWTLLYAIIALSFGYVFVQTYHGKIPWIVALPFALNLIFNIAFTPIQFGLKNLSLASVDIILVLATLIWALVAVYPHSKVVAYVNIPYLLWVSFATCLQLTIMYLNRG